MGINPITLVRTSWLRHFVQINFMCLNDTRTRAVAEVCDFVFTVVIFFLLIAINFLISVLNHFICIFS
jgi:hypothetical protein